MVKFKIAYLLALLLACPPVLLNAQTAFKTGEETTGMTKQCYYSFGVNKYTRTVQATTLCPLNINVSPPNQSTRYSPPAPETYTEPTKPTTTYFKTGEETTGMTKQCYYSFGVNKFTKTVQATTLCPLNIQVRSP